MPIAGPTVADAYVELHADTDFLNAEIKAAARRVAGKFSDDVNKAIESRMKRDRIDLADMIATGDFSAMERKFGGVEQAVRGVDSQLRSLRRRSQLTAQDLAKYRSVLSAWANTRKEQIADETALLYDQATALRDQADERASEMEDRRQIDLALRRIGDRMAKQAQIDKDHAEALRLQARWVEQQRDDWEALGRIQERAYAENLRRSEQLKQAELERYRLVARAEEEMYRAIGRRRRTDETVIRENARLLRRLRDAWRRAGEEDGREYGIMFVRRLRGSRNDFLNAMGIVLGGIEGAIANTFGRIGEAISDALVGDGSQGFGKFASNVGSVFSSLAASAVALVAVLSVVGTLLGPIVALVSNLVAIVAALASSISFALAGALLSLGPIIGAGVAGLAVFATALAGMDDEMKSALDGLKEWGEEVSRIAAARVFARIGEQVQGITPILERFSEELVPRIGDALAGAFDGFVAVLNSPEFDRALTVFEDTWPGILTNLGRIGNAAFSGISSVLAALSPLVEDVTGLIADGLEEWSRWAGSAEGQNSLSEWFDDAWASADTLWSILNNVWDILGKVFESGQDTGDTWLEGINDALERFSEWLDTPEGRDELLTWFEDAKTFASEAADAIENISDNLAQFNDPESQEDLNTLVESLGSLADILNTINSLRLTTSGGLFSLLEVLNNWDAAWAGVGSWWSGVWESISDGWNQLWEGDFLGPVKEVWQGIEDFFAGIDWEDLFANLTGANLVTWFLDMLNDWAEDAIASIPDIVGPVGMEIIEGIIQGLEDWADNLNPTWSTIINGMIDWVKGLLGIASPSTVFAEIGADIIAGLLQGLEDTWNTITSWFTTAIAAIIALFGIDQFVVMGTNIITGIAQGLDSNRVLLAVAGLIPGIVAQFAPADFFSMGADIITGIVNGVNSNGWRIGAALAGIVGGIVLPSIAGPTIDMSRSKVIGTPNVPDLPRSAIGGIFAGAQARIIGEAGREAVVPLDRSPSRVDPAVRPLAEFAQGRMGAGVTVESGAIVVQGVVDPETNASMVLDRLVTAIVA